MADTGLGRAYRRLWTAATVSNLGDGVFLTALPLAAAAQTRSAIGVSAVTVALTLPWLLFALLTGALVDRWHKLTAMARTDAARAAVTALLAAAVALDAATVPVLVAAAFVLGCGNTVYDTASLACIPALVGADRARLQRANARLEGARIVANDFVGPPIGGALFAAIPAAPIALDAVSFLASASLLGAIRAHEPPPPARQAGTTLRAEIAVGLRWLRAAADIRRLAVTVGVINVGFSAAGALLVLLVQRTSSSADALGYGVVLTVGAVGSILGNVAADRLAGRIPMRVTVAASAAVCGASLAAMGAAPSTPVLAAAFAAGGFAGSVWNVVTVAYRQAVIPPDLLGRVNSVYRLLAFGALPLGAAAGGLLADRLGLRVPYVAAGVLILVAAAALAVKPFDRDRDRDPVYSDAAQGGGCLDR